MEFEVSQIRKSACEGSVLTYQARRSALFFSRLAVSSLITAYSYFLRFGVWRGVEGPPK
jgi:hypothetical protein